jgi:ribonuclease HI
MRTSGPHYLLFAGALSPDNFAAHWRFVLQPIGSESTLAVDDIEEFARPSRMELLAVVRGLEALEQPSRVTLLSDSRYVVRGIRRGVNQWRERRWRWERFGRLVPIRDADLWRRIDRAMQFHEVDCLDWPDDEPRYSVFERQIDAASSDMGLELAGPASPALVIVDRRKRAVATRIKRSASWSAALDRLRQGVLAQAAAIRGAEFTWAA